MDHSQRMISDKINGVINDDGVDINHIPCIHYTDHPSTSLNMSSTGTRITTETPQNVDPIRIPSSISSTATASTDTALPLLSGAAAAKSALSRRRSPATPSSPSGSSIALVKKVSFNSSSFRSTDDNIILDAPDVNNTPQTSSASHQQPNLKKHSKITVFSEPGTKPMTNTSSTVKPNGNITNVGHGNHHLLRHVSHCDPVSPRGTKAENYNLFRTKSARLERQLSRLQSLQGQADDACKEIHTPETHIPPCKKDPVEGAVSAGRYFDALRGPELEILKDSEELLLPIDQPWPFLLRLPIGCFGISLGLGSQAMLWKALATSPSMSFLNVPIEINMVLWCLALLALFAIVATYAMKFILYFEAVRREYHHPVRVNFFFAPWIACMFLALGVPPRIAASIHPSLWCLFVFPLLLLELKIYGQWLSGGQRRLSKVANPSTHLSLVGNFVSALLAATIDWKEPAIFFWAVGCAHYLVLFVTLYQRLPTAEALPRELHPVFFLFVAAPSTASVAWRYIVGEFDQVSRVCYFIALFLYSSLVVRIKFFCGIRFSIAWWAYTFPMTASAIASIHYAMAVVHPFTKALAVLLSGISSLTVICLFGCTILHASWGTLFPNDIAIAITYKKQKAGKQKAAENQKHLSPHNSNCSKDIPLVLEHQPDQAEERSNHSFFRTLKF